MTLEPDVEYLYHYTSIEKLALILKNRTIRLNPLDKMDDLQEQKTADVENIGKFVFISSWTDDTDESIPMWKMYTDPLSGVRIKLRKNPFIKHGTVAKNLAEATGLKLMADTAPDAELPTFLDFASLADLGAFSAQAYGGDILVKVSYTDDLEKLEPRIVKIGNGNVEIDLGDLGRYKNTHWAFQNEWRYIMIFMSMNFKVGVEAMTSLFSQSIVKMTQGKEPPPFRFFDLDIDPQCFEEMEITCSPQMSIGNRVLLESLVEKFNPKAKIVDSDLLGKI